MKQRCFLTTVYAANDFFGQGGYQVFDTRSCLQSRGGRRIFTGNAENFKNTESSIKSVRRTIKTLWGQKKVLIQTKFSRKRWRPNKKLSIRSIHSIHSIHSKRHPQRLFRS